MIGERLLSAMRLGRWLGPWTSDEAVPSGITRHSLDVERDDGETFRLWIYTPRGIVCGAYLIAPGLHFAGPADPRLDRFCRILAQAGFIVAAPFLPDYISLRVAPTVADDLGRALEALRGEIDLATDARPGIFSISFGSLPALQVAGDARWRDRVAGLIVFGGYADWRRAVHFCVTGERPGDPAKAPRPHDPLNRPVIFINLIEAMPGAPDDPGPLLSAWRNYVVATWNRPEMKEPGVTKPIAESIAAGLPPEQRELFLQGCGHAAGGVDLVEAALERSGDRFDYLDPTPAFERITCPVHVMHGRDDDVIPYTEAEALERALPDDVHAGTYLTGMYQHTGAGLASDARSQLSELTTLLRMLRTMAAVGARA